MDGRLVTTFSCASGWAGTVDVGDDGVVVTAVPAPAASGSGAAVGAVAEPSGAGAAAAAGGAVERSRIGLLPGNEGDCDFLPGDAGNAGDAGRVADECVLGATTGSGLVTGDS
jgi:hypothetical protein